jgi:hypothetical protein
MLNDCPLTTIASVREGPLLLPTVKPTSPGPVPVLNEDTRTHSGTLSTVHAHPESTITLNADEAIPPIGTFIDVGLSDSEHRGAVAGGSCVTAIDNPPILTEPDRGEEPSFALTPNVLLPDPATEPVGTPIHATSVPTDHLHSAAAVIEKATSCAAAVNLTLDGASEAGQGTGAGGAASWVTAIASPPILTEPDRADEPSFALTLNLLVPDPATEPVGTPIHATSVPTDHLQSADAEIEKATASCAAAVNLTLDGATEAGHGAGGGGAASWVTEIVRPPTLTSPERADPSFALTANTPIADPAPERVWMTIHDAFVEADHLQSADAETAKLTVSPLAFTRTLPGSTEAGHGAGAGAGAGAASWETEIVCPPMLTLPEREGLSLALTTNAPLPDPAPERVWMTIHDAFVEADHVQSADAETAKLTVSPLAFTRTLPGSTEAGHGPGSGVRRGGSGMGSGNGTGEGVGVGVGVGRGDGVGPGEGVGAGAGDGAGCGGIGDASVPACVTRRSSSEMRTRPWRTSSPVFG